MLRNFKYIDLFCGIGGFHQAMNYYGGKCVFASEIDQDCIKIYEKNYKIDCNFDITKIDEKENIPKHDVLCAGFPCQAFSKAGKQEGVNDTRGTLFFDIERILKFHKTKYIILENVRNLVSHDKGNTWKIIQTKLKELGYRLTEKPLILSPHEFGIPQLRERVFILGVYDEKNVEKPLEISINNKMKKMDNSIYSIVSEEKVADKYYINDYENKILNAWDEFYLGIKEHVIGFPIWAEWLNEKNIPKKIPKWKQEFIEKNQKFYLNNKEFIDSWLIKNNNLKDFKPTHKKFEWQANNSISSLWEGVIQFRPSGIRVKKPDIFPALVAIVQIPIIGKYKRRLSVEECSKLQSFKEDFLFSESDLKAYKQFGNSVNVDIVKLLFEKLTNEY